MVLFTFVGVAGLLCLLLAFFLAESGKVKTSLRTYTLLNAAGSFFLIIYSLYISAWVFIILNVVWFAVAVMNMIRPGRSSRISFRHDAWQGQKPRSRHRR